MRNHTKNIENEVIQAYQKVREVFPFPGYMDNKLHKYITIVSQIMVKGCDSDEEILSIGSGPCDFEAILSELGFHVTAVDDLNDLWHLIGSNRERIMEFAKQMDIRLLVEPVGSSELKKDFFDVVLFIDIIEHLHNSPRRLLNYSISFLKPGGLLLVETPNAVALANRVKVLFGKSSQVKADFFYWNIGEYRSHIREYTLPELIRILSHHNLEELDARMTNAAVEMVERPELPSEKGFQILIRAYQLISQLYPNFRSTILISGKKPKSWSPTPYSIERFGKYYPHLREYNLDNEPVEVLASKIQRLSHVCAT